MHQQPQNPAQNSPEKQPFLPAPLPKVFPVPKVSNKDDYTWRGDASLEAFNRGELEGEMND